MDGKTMNSTDDNAKLVAKIAALEAALDEAKLAKSKKLHMKVGAKGGASLYGLGRFPVTLYKQQWLILIDNIDEVKAFIVANDKLLKNKGDE